MERHHATVYRLVANLARWQAPAEELAQEVFVAAYAALGSFDPARGRFLTWLCTIARNRALNVARKPLPIPVAELPPQPASGNPLESLLQRELGQRLDRALASLPEEQRATFVLGDAREAAVDSRDYGPVPFANVIGRVTHRWHRGLTAHPAGTCRE